MGCPSNLGSANGNCRTPSCRSEHSNGENASCHQREVPKRGASSTQEENSKNKSISLFSALHLRDVTCCLLGSSEKRKLPNFSEKTVTLLCEPWRKIREKKK